MESFTQLCAFASPFCRFDDKRPLSAIWLENNFAISLGDRVNLRRREKDFGGVQAGVHKTVSEHPPNTFRIGRLFLRQTHRVTRGSLGGLRPGSFFQKEFEHVHDT